MALNLAMSVLVVDDSKLTINIIRGLLKHLGFMDVDDAADGATALAKMREKRYGLVISDWNMVPMSGYELLRELRNDPALKRMPFIMVTSAHSPEISDWEGSGDAVIGIHGPLGDGREIGTAGARVSHGCIRLHDADLARLSMIPAGTPIEVIA